MLKGYEVMKMTVVKANGKELESNVVLGSSWSRFSFWMLNNPFVDKANTFILLRSWGFISAIKTRK